MKPVGLSFDAALNSIIERYDAGRVRKKFKGWVNAIQFSFPGIERIYTFEINGDEGIEMSEGAYAEAVIKVTIDSDLFVQLLSKQINAIKAYSSGLLRVEGAMKNLLKARYLLF